MSTLIILSALILLRLHQIHRANADLTCPKNCRPYEVEINCNKTTRECSEGCKTGFYGLTCDKTCRCGGGACVVTDGTCMTTPSVKPEPVSPGHHTQDCRTDGFVAGICVLCAVVVILIVAVAILIVKLRRFSKRSNRPQTNRPEDQPLTGNGQTEPPIALHQSEKEQLVHDLGVHILCDENNPSQPVLLYCVHMKYDYRRVNSETTHITRERYLVNDKDSKAKDSKANKFEERFNGTTSLSPTIHGDIPTYWEVHSHVHLKNKLQPTDLLLCIGFCRETERDNWFQTPNEPHCYNLNVGTCSKHEKICTKIYNGGTTDAIVDVQSGIENKAGQDGDLKYGVLVCKGKRIIVYFDLAKKQSIARLENVDFKRPLWPLFGVFKRSVPRVRMKLETGRDIKMSQDKKDMILSALSSV